MKDYPYQWAYEMISKQKKDISMGNIPFDGEKRAINSIRDLEYLIIRLKKMQTIPKFIK